MTQQINRSQHITFTLLVYSSILLTLLTVVLSAYIRLSTNGLGCEPWPDCYGYVGSMEQYDAASSFTTAQPKQPHGAAGNKTVRGLHCLRQYWVSHYFSQFWDTARRHRGFRPSPLATWWAAWPCWPCSGGWGNPCPLRQ